MVAGLAAASLAGLPAASAAASGVPATPAPKPPASGVHEQSMGGENDVHTGAIRGSEQVCKPKGPNTRAAMGKSENACNPDTDWVFQKTIAWDKTGEANGKPIGTLKVTVTNRPAPGTVTTNTATAPVTTKTTNTAPPTDSTAGDKSTSGGVTPYSSTGNASGGCCSDAGIAAHRWTVSSYNNFFPGLYDHNWDYTMIWSTWWGGGIPGVQWGVVIPYPYNPGASITWAYCDAYHDPMHGSCYEDHGYALGYPYNCCPYFYYNWANRGPQAGLALETTRVVQSTLWPFTLYYPQLNVFMHQDGSWYVSWNDGENNP